MARARGRRLRQGELGFKSWGGPRPGAGRKSKGERAGVSHSTRAPLASRYPVHVTARLRKGLPSLRYKRPYLTLLRAFHAGSERFGFRLVHYSVQSNHLHLIAEAKDRRALTRGLQGLLIRIAKALNKLWERRGRVFTDRYHDRILRTPREVRNALKHVLHNARRHGIYGPAPDPYSSGRWFYGWRERFERLTEGVERPLAQARTWLLEFGWRHHGPIGLQEPVGPARARPKRVRPRTANGVRRSR